jgi:hypothetical protein
MRKPAKTTSRELDTPGCGGIKFKNRLNTMLCFTQEVTRVVKKHISEVVIVGSIILTAEF